MLQKARNWVRAMWNADLPPADLDAALADLRAKHPAPVLWLFGKTQSGKTSIIRYLTGAEDAAIGSGFRPCTTTTREYPFPGPDAPVLTFLDTRGLDEPGYDPAPDIAACDARAHVMIVTARIRDLAQGGIREPLKIVRAANRRRPVVLAVTCLHELDPTNAHPQPYPYSQPGGDAADPVRRLIAEHMKQFDGLIDAVVPIDLTKADEGYADPDYGGEQLKQAILGQLPAAYRQTLVQLDAMTGALKDLHLKHAVPVIIGYASMAASAGAIPIPFVDLVLIPAIQSRMVYHLAKVYGQPLSAERFLEMSASLGMGLLARQAMQEVTKFIPFVGSAAAGALAWGSTYALGRAFCLYYQEVHAGHVPDPARLKKFYREQFAAAEKTWKPAT